MEEPALRMPACALAAMERSRGVQPVYRIDSAGPGALFAAKWRLTDSSVATGGSSQAILGYRTAGTAIVTRRSERASVRRRPAIGSVTFASAECAAHWTAEGATEVLHVYIPQSALRRFAEQELETDRVPVIRDFFGEVDPWLRGYFQMLDSEADALGAERQATCTLLLAETEQLLLRHLFRRHSDADADDPTPFESGRAPVPLGPVVLRRVQEYIDANLTADIHLDDLASLGYMSAGHFLRRFRATCGTTPYQYVLEQRLQRARTLLVESPEPIARIAQVCGFRTASHLSSRFHARFGLRPSSCREDRATGRRIASRLRR